MSALGFSDKNKMQKRPFVLIIDDDVDAKKKMITVANSEFFTRVEHGQKPLQRNDLVKKQRMF